MDRVAFSILGIDVMWYGILIATGMILAVFIAIREAGRVGYNDNDVVDLSLFLLPLGIIGARIHYVIFSWDYYSKNPAEILNIRGGGLAIHGGIIAGIVTVLIYTKIKKFDFYKFADVVILGVPLAQAIGRWGNFINKEAHGGPTNLPWGILIDGQKVHPTFLYESLWNVVVFGILFFRRKNKKYEGQLLVDYIILYSIGRFFVEGLRTDSLMIGPLRIAQLLSFIGVIVGFILSGILRKRSKNGV